MSLKATLMDCNFCQFEVLLSTADQIHCRAWHHRSVLMNPYFVFTSLSGPTDTVSSEQSFVLFKEAVAALII